MRKCFLLIVIAGLLAFATSAFASTELANTNTVQPTLQISATVQSAVGLFLGTGSIAGHCTVVATGSSPDYTMNFQTVDAMGVNTGCGAVYAPAQGSTGATYYTDYTFQPVWSGQGSTGATVTAYVSATPESGLTVEYSTTAPTGAGSFAALSTNSASPTTLGSAITPSGTKTTSYLGLLVAAGASPTSGAIATVTYTATIH